MAKAETAKQEIARELELLAGIATKEAKRTGDILGILNEYDRDSKLREYLTKAEEFVPVIGINPTNDAALHGIRFDLVDGVSIAYTADYGIVEIGTEDGGKKDSVITALQPLNEMSEAGKNKIFADGHFQNMQSTDVYALIEKHLLGVATAIHKKVESAGLPLA